MARKPSQHKVFLIGLSAIALSISANSASAETGSVENGQAQSLPPLEINSLSQVTPSPELVTNVETEPTAEEAKVQVAQAPIIPGRSTRSGPSYIGIGGNIGLGGDTTLGDSGFAVISKIGLTRNLSARPGVVIGDNDPTVLVPVTLDFPISSVAEAGEIRLAAAPYVGGGIAISTGSESLVRPLITAGVDVPVATRVTATAGVNFAFFDDTEIGLILGVGYNF
ncbi:MAG: hypothetical protein HC781_23105 [Leptolyngbyaceae cyanobacterium CSU_1_4]|nr:hypothetical protein [Leptolyngbyaceae cyanobacterium CSU_1_4]